jgi:hypothetical protein
MRDRLGGVTSLVKPSPPHLVEVGALLDNLGDDLMDGMLGLTRVRICEVARGA